MPEKNTLIGGIIKNVRLGNGLDLQEVAKQAGISEELLEKIEALEVNPSLGLVVRFAEIFGVPVGKLMGDSADSSFCIVRRNAGTAISRFASANGRTAGYRYEGLAEQKKDRQMEPFLVTLAPNEVHSIEPSEHVGEEFIFVLTGRVKVTLLDHTDILNPGDSIYFDSSLPHIVVCEGDEPATILAVIHVKYEMIIF